MKTQKFSATIEKIGINPFVYLPDSVLAFIFIQANKNKGKIPVKIKMDGFEFTQTLIKYSGYWRLYLNAPMRKAAGKDVGDTANFEIQYDPSNRKIKAHPQLLAALKENAKAKQAFDLLSPYLQKEIVRYISHLKTEKSIQNNIQKAIAFLQGKESFIGRSGIDINVTRTKK